MLTLKAPKKKQPSMYTHTHNIFFLMKIKKNKESPQRKEKKSPLTQKYTLKSFPRAPGFRVYAQGEEKRRTGGSIQELLLHHGACSDHPSCC